MGSIKQYEFCTSVLWQFLSSAKPKYRIISVFEGGHLIQAIEYSYAIIKTITRPNLKCLAPQTLALSKRAIECKESLKKNSKLITPNHSHKHHRLSNPFPCHPYLFKAFAISSVRVFHHHIPKLPTLP